MTNVQFSISNAKVRRIEDGKDLRAGEKNNS
jgi:hypothetical protein